MSKDDPHILGKESIGKLLLQYSIPVIIGIAITSTCNIIDSIFTGHGVGAMAIAGLAVSFPLMSLVVAFCTLVSAGGSTIASIRLGQKDMKGAMKILSHTLMLCITSSFFFGILSFTSLDDILTFSGASPNTLPYARSFMQVILLGTPITYAMIGLNNVTRATGYPKKAMLTSMVMVIANIILVPIFIFHFEWGMRGAVAAMIIPRLIGMVWVVSHFRKKDNTVHFEGKVWKIKGRIVESIFAIGMSPFLMNVCACAIVIVINNSLQEHGGDMVIGAYGIISRLLTLYVVVILGLAMGMQPIVGCNFGAQKIGQVKQTLKLGIISGIVITSNGFLICEFSPHAASTVFTDSDELIGLAVDGLRLTVLVSPFVGAQTVIGNFFQSIGKAKIGVFLSLTRQLLHLLSYLLLFPHWWGLKGIWISLPVSDSLAFITAVISLTIYIKKISKEHPIADKMAE